MTEFERISIELEADMQWLNLYHARVAMHLKRLSELGDEL